MIIQQLSPIQVRDGWEEIAPILAPAVLASGGRELIEDIQKDLIECRTSAFSVFEDGVIIAVVTVRLVQFSRQKDLYIELVGGRRMREWISKMLQILSEYGKGLGASSLLGDGRRGFEKVLPAHGFNTVAVQFEKVLS